MTKLVAIAYPDEATAGEVAHTLIELQLEQAIALDDLAVAVRDDDGKLELRRPTRGLTAKGAPRAIDDSLIEDLAAKLKPGHAAIFVLVRRSTLDKVLPRVSQYGGEVIHNSRSRGAEETLREALREPAAT